MFKRIALLILIVSFAGSLWSQDFGFGFGFGDDEESESGGQSYAASTGRALSFSVGGEISAGIIGYLHDFSGGPANINTLEMFMLSGKLNFSAKTSFAEGLISLNVVPALIPVSIDEAYIRAFFGNFDISAGLKKVTWGKADQMGPLDILNMINMSKIFIEMADSASLMGVKIANPIVHTTYRFGRFSKLEGVFLPSFEVISSSVSAALGSSNPLMALLIGSTAERWIPSQMQELYFEIGEDTKLFMPVTSGLDYAQGGLRFTTSVRSADIGAQYFYGRMYQPAVRKVYDSSNALESVEFFYNKYHHIGIDYAQVVFGFNLRAEVAANITEDIRGKDAHVYNPSIGWSFGFDRDVIGFNINFQANGSVRLLNSKVGTAPFDIESGTSVTATRLTAMLSRKFLREEIELRTAVVWGIEDKDVAIMPAVIWVRDDLRAALSGGFFLGDSNGQLGQYKNNNFLKISVTYMF